MNIDNSGIKRISQEFNEIKNSMKIIGGSVIIKGNINHLRVYIKGPKESPYENGIFYLDISFKTNYPTSRPEIKFLTKIWHPNISEDTGHIVLYYIRQWNEKSNIKEAIMSIFELMAVPNFAEPLNCKVNPQDYDKMTREYTEKYAGKFQDYGMEIGDDIYFIIIKQEKLILLIYRRTLQHLQLSELRAGSFRRR